MFKEYQSSLLNPSEFIGIGKGINRSVEVHCPDDPYLFPKCKKISDVTEKIELYQGRKRSNPHTSTLKSLRDDRKVMLDAIDGVVKTKLKLEILEPENAKIAQELHEILRETPVVTSGSQLIVSHQTNTRIRRLDLVKYRTMMKTIGISTAFDKLIQIQAEIEQTSAEKDVAESEKLKGTVNDLVKELKSTIEYVFPYIESNSVEQPKIFASPAKEIHETVVRIMAAAHNRRGRKDSDEDIDIIE